MTFGDRITPAGSEVERPSEIKSPPRRDALCSRASQARCLRLTDTATCLVLVIWRCEPPRPYKPNPAEPPDRTNPPNPETRPCIAHLPGICTVRWLMTVVSRGQATWLTQSA